MARSRVLWAGRQSRPDPARWPRGRGESNENHHVQGVVGSKGVQSRGEPERTIGENNWRKSIACQEGLVESGNAQSSAPQALTQPRELKIRTIVTRWKQSVACEQTRSRCNRSLAHHHSVDHNVSVSGTWWWQPATLQ